MHVSKKISVYSVVLAITTVIGFMSAEAFAGFYEFCDPTCIGPSCPGNCAAPVCAPLGVNCSTDNSGVQDCCGPAAFTSCTNTNACSGKCGGASPTCACTTTSGGDGC